MDGPSGLADGPNAEFLYVTNSADGNVNQFAINSTSGALTAIASPVAAGSLPGWIAVTPNAQFAYVTNFGDGTISEYTVDTTTGELTANGTFASTLLATPTAAVASNTFLYVSDNTNGSIVSFPINTDGTLAAGLATVLTGVSPKPGPLILDPTGAFVYATDSANGSVYFLSVETLGLTLNQLYSSSPFGVAGLAITVTPSGVELLFVANQMAPTPSISIFVVDTSGLLTFSKTFTDTSLNLPTGLVVDPMGTNLYVANQGSGTITHYTINAVAGQQPSITNPVVTKTESPTSKPLFLVLGE